MDPRKLREFRELGDDTDEFLLDILDRYFTKSEEQLAEAREALAAGDAKTLRDVIHSWKGATTALGLTELSRALTELNARLKDDADNQVGAALDDLARGLKELRQSREDDA